MIMSNPTFIQCLLHYVLFGIDKPGEKITSNNADAKSSVSVKTDMFLVCIII